MNINWHIKMATDWILYSGIQNLCVDSDSYGCFHAYYDQNNYAYAHPYPEITGYALSVLASIATNFPHLKNDVFTKGKSAVQYLKKSCLFNERETLQLHDINNGRGHMVYTFDVGMILKGFLHYYEYTKNEVEPVCYEIGEWLMNMQKPDGSFYAYYDTVSNKKQDTLERWSTQSGPHLMKLTMVFHMLYQHTMDSL